jgi:putative transposase
MKRKIIPQTQERIDCSERRVCKATRISRSSQRYKRVRENRDLPLMEAILKLVMRYPRYGYRAITAKLRANGWVVNAKRVYRLWRKEGLKVPRKARKQRAKGGSKNSYRNRPPAHKDDVWAMDFIFDSTASGGTLKMLVVEDEFTRELLAFEVGGKGFNGNKVAEVLTDLFSTRGVPKAIRSDNGSEFVGRVVSDRLGVADVNPLRVEAGCPWENCMVESLNSIIRDDLLNVEMFGSVREAKNSTTAWKLEYNNLRPHGSLKYKTPAWFAENCQPAPDSASLRPTQSGSSKKKIRF